MSGHNERQFRAGAHASDITPEKFPISVNGMMNNRLATKAYDPIHARCLVLDDGHTTLALVVCDNLMIMRELLDEAKTLAHQKTGIAVDRIMISATHTHAAPSVTHCFQSVPDVDYGKFLVRQIVLGIEAAWQKLAPARIGWAVTEDPTQVFCRMWIIKNPGWNPFGKKTDRALMHPGYLNPNCIEPAGPADPALTLLAVQTSDGRPLALFANYSMHYAEDKPYVSADYFGEFCRKFSGLIGTDKFNPAFVAMLANGTMGDAHCFDYSRGKQPRTRASVGESLANAAHAAYQAIQYHDHVPLVMLERRIKLAVRKPSSEEVVKAKEVLEKAGARELKGWTEIYSRETVLLDKYPDEVEMRLQALRIGGLGIVTVPVEAYTATGLTIKQRSALKPTCVIGLANGYNGYMAPPEQHEIGGYSTWRARSSYLETGAAPKVIATLVDMLQEVAGTSLPSGNKPDVTGAYSRKILESSPRSYWRMNELTGNEARDIARAQSHGKYERRVVYYLSGPPTATFAGFGPKDRAPYFFDQRMSAQVDGMQGNYSVELWFCHSRPPAKNIMTSFFLSHPGRETAAGDHLGITSSANPDQNKLILSAGNAPGNVSLQGASLLLPNSWYHLVMVREGPLVRVHLNGASDPELAGTTAARVSAGQIFIGGHADNTANFEGKLCHVSFYNRALHSGEIASHYAAAVHG